MPQNYDNKKAIAKHLYVGENRTAKEIALKVSVTEKTLSTWVNKYGWKEERNAKSISSKKRLANIDAIINNLAEKRLNLEQNLQQEENKPKPNMEAIEVIRKDITAVDYAVANWNKTRKDASKEGAISASIYYEVMDDIFQSLLKYNQELYLKTLDFQNHHVETIASRQKVL